MNPGREIALVDYVGRRVGEPFTWGLVDCNVLGLECFDIVAGTALANLVRGRYATRLGALRFWRAHGGRILGYAQAGAWRIGPRHMAVGDFVLASWRGVTAAHVCMGSHVASATPERGVCLVRPRDLDPGWTAWRVF